MAYNPQIHHRRSIRLKGYDYAQPGLYFITICVKNRKCLFGHIENDEMILNDAGKMVENEWLKIPQRFINTQLHEYVVMPNHFHAILEIVGTTHGVTQNKKTQPDVGATLVVAPNKPDKSGQPGKPGQPGELGESGQPDKPGQPGEPGELGESGESGQPDKPGESGQPQGIAPTGIAPTGIAPTGIAPTGIGPTGVGPTGVAPTGIGPTKKTLGDMVGAFQSIVTVEYIRGVKNKGWQPFNGKLLQRNYWEHIIRNQSAYQRITQYIINNPKNWDNDKLKLIK